MATGPEDAADVDGSQTRRQRPQAEPGTVQSRRVKGSRARRRGVKRIETRGSIRSPAAGRRSPLRSAPGTPADPERKARHHNTEDP